MLRGTRSGRVDPRTWKEAQDDDLDLRGGMSMLSEDTGDCLALANTAILMRLIEELIESGAVAQPTALLHNAVGDLQDCRERSARVDDAIRVIRMELMPRLLRPGLVDHFTPADSGKFAPELPEIMRYFVLATAWHKAALLLPRYQRKLQRLTRLGFRGSRGSASQRPGFREGRRAPPQFRIRGVAHSSL